jgi:predicted Fe-Mo cluster-binding NifX family protein
VKIVVTSSSTDLDAPTSRVFGRAPFYVLVDTETMSFEALENPERRALRGVGFYSPEWIVERGAQAVVTGSVGPNAFRVLQDLGLPVYLSAGGTVRKAVEAYRAGRLQPAEGPNVSTHSGRYRGTSVDRWTDTWDAAPASPASREKEIAALTETAEALRGRLARVQQRLEELKEGEQ